MDVFLKMPLEALDTTPALARTVIGALLNAAYQANGNFDGRILYLLDEVARLGYMRIIETARDAGRKFGITMQLLYQSTGQIEKQWGMEGKRAWYRRRLLSHLRRGAGYRNRQRTGVAASVAMA